MSSICSGYLITLSAALIWTHLFVQKSLEDDKKVKMKALSPKDIHAKFKVY